MRDAAVVIRDVIDDPALLPDGIAGIDAGLTLTKVALRTQGGVELVASETAATMDVYSSGDSLGGARRVGVTGARGDRFGRGERSVRVQEIEAAAHGAIALIGPSAPPEFVLALMGTGTAFAAVREGTVSHLGGTPMGGGSFAAIARRVVPGGVTYAELVERAAKGDRRNADLMVSDAYPQGIGRIGGDLTAAHLAKDGASADDFLAGLLNMHGENIAQIAAGRGNATGIRQVVLAGGFVHGNDALIASMKGMLRMFGTGVDVAPHAGFAGAVGAALMASKA